MWAKHSILKGWRVEGSHLALKKVQHLSLSPVLPPPWFSLHPFINIEKDTYHWDQATWSRLRIQNPQNLKCNISWKVILWQVVLINHQHLTSLSHAKQQKRLCLFLFEVKTLTKNENQWESEEERKLRRVVTYQITIFPCIRQWVAGNVNSNQSEMWGKSTNTQKLGVSMTMLTWWACHP